MASEEHDNPRLVELLPNSDRRDTPEFSGQLMGIGKSSLLTESTVGLIASRKCPGRAFVEMLDRVPRWVEENRILLSGFHSPLEKQVLHSLLRRKGRIVKVLARGINTYRASDDERLALEEGRLLVLTSFPPQVRRTTRATALERNRLIVALATELVVPHVSEGSPLAEIIAEHKAGASSSQIFK